MQFAQQDQGDNLFADPDADANGLTPVIDLKAGDKYGNIDVSMQKVVGSDELAVTYANIGYGTIRGRLSPDSNGDSTESNGAGAWDDGIVGQTVQLLDLNGNVVDETTTGDKGWYQFDAEPSSYASSRFAVHDGYKFGEQDKGHLQRRFRCECHRHDRRHPPESLARDTAILTQVSPRMPRRPMRIMRPRPRLRPRGRPRKASATQDRGDRRGSDRPQAGQGTDRQRRF